MFLTWRSSLVGSTWTQKFPMLSAFCWLLVAWSFTVGVSCLCCSYGSCWVLSPWFLRSMVMTVNILSQLVIRCSSTCTRSKISNFAKSTFYVSVHRLCNYSRSAMSSPYHRDAFLQCRQSFSSGSWRLHEFYHICLGCWFVKPIIVWSTF